MTELVKDLLAKAGISADAVYFIFINFGEGEPNQLALRVHSWGHAKGRLIAQTWVVQSPYDADTMTKYTELSYDPDKKLFHLNLTALPPRKKPKECDCWGILVPDDPQARKNKRRMPRGII